MTRTCERRRLETFIKEYLVQNPISAAAKKSKKLSEWYNRKGGHALSNRLVAPINQREVLLHRINAFTLCVKRDYLVDATITIQKCVDVRFYFCASMKNVSIEGCKDSTFVLAAVSGITRINDCTNCTFIVSTRVIHALNLVDCKSRDQISNFTGDKATAPI